MPQAFILTLREGLEAFLIVAISMAYLKKTCRSDLVRAVHWGIGISVILCLGLAIPVQRVANQALLEGMLALAAAVLGCCLFVHVWRAAMRTVESPRRVHNYPPWSGRPAYLGMFGMFFFTVLMITREGIETVNVMQTLLFQIKSVTAIAFATAGLLLAVVMAWTWLRYGTRLDLESLSQVTALFLLLFAAHK